VLTIPEGNEHLVNHFRVLSVVNDNNHVTPS
jgi:hypothetical protein